MGFYIRKALRVGPFRFNLSKSGIGVSAGIKGLRLGTGPRGNYVHMGRGGLYFRKSLSPAGASPTRPRPRPVSGSAAPVDTVQPLEEIESASASKMVDASSAGLLEELNSKRRKVRLFPIAAVFAGLVIIAALVNSAPSWLLATMAIFLLIGLWLVRMKDQLRKTTVIFYELDDSMEALYQRVHEAFEELRKCSRVWHISHRGAVKDRKYHAGAGAVVKRRQIHPAVGGPPFLKTNVQIPQIPVGRQTLAFMPDRLLVLEPNAVGAVPYADLKLDIGKVDFVEDEAVPRDAAVVGKTWRYVNKKGGPDKRFKDNREIPVCAYDQIHFLSDSGLNEVVQFSRHEVAVGFRHHVERLAAATKDR